MARINSSINSATPPQSQVALQEHRERARPTRAQTSNRSVTSGSEGARERPSESAAAGRGTPKVRQQVRVETTPAQRPSANGAGARGPDSTTGQQLDLLA